MDVFDELLRGVRGRGAVFGRSVLWPPWSLRFTDGAYLTLCLPLRGAGWIVPETGEARHVALGEAAIVRGPAPFSFTDDPAHGTGAERATGVREVRWGEDTPDPVDLDGELDCSTVLLAATYDVRAQVPQRLLRALPPVLVVPDEDDCSPLRDYLEAQIGGSRPGQQIVLDRLLDWLLVCTLRDWFDRPEAEPPGWYGALGDAVAGPALRAIHEDPAHPWTTAELAGRAGVSRTTLAKRFTELVGDGPVAYLTEWRMTLAADLLTRPELTVAAVARRVGYADAFGFSAAFKRLRGESPTAYRQKAAAPGLPDRAVPAG
ncbi:MULTISPECIES: AraC family transcriptional regulator [unclassified Streptomyces]|uniref:AraC family transcriptional regulator n=1 Tax=unclassified Streptomyces TaxID=2593676 RepID=UPI0001C1B0F5|nr:MULTISPECIES: AraC family transcriptional regulator [unclassified Streptomyces]MYR65955.1 helix-turn-helix domain-containing protein [Streptomyces sp. SID4939]MYR99037.1 helix-turn-helix domain-containing protein [Streptomyces sp. SID4940]MYT63718.1 helix-turn-helix domain-containing protein [Streptomyces sp. SID8357]MYT85968.1 helix-turn-helix domain-containing protein [Streptomyces sp. SID8360]MYW38481.1 helix-turn-helix domain-containing protein [Streptomyces sp. SID1]